MKVGRPTASILLLAYNHAPFIEAALLSALRQDAAGYELVIVDD
ncbi:glycosyltransferase family 2 protein, partial [bacterium]|nr:glycosyltransferase family 2 protein [bacterium]